LRRGQRRNGYAVCAVPEWDRPSAASSSGQAALPPRLIKAQASFLNTGAVECHSVEDALAGEMVAARPWREHPDPGPLRALETHSPRTASRRLPLSMGLAEAPARRISVLSLTAWVSPSG